MMHLTHRLLPNPWRCQAGKSRSFHLLLVPLLGSLTGISECEPLTDEDGDYYSPEGGDCDDLDANTYPDAPELCDTRDNDCDGTRDEGLDCSGIIHAVVGDHRYYGYSGDGGDAYHATLYGNHGLLVAPDGSYYISDTANARIRRVDTAGIIQTVAGTGTVGFAGDGGPAVAAQFNFPLHLAMDHQGRLLIADVSNNRIRRIGVDGIITTAAGNGTQAFTGDGGLATEASLNNPWAVIVAPDNSFYIADTNNDRIRHVNAQGIITTVAGDGNSGYDGDGQPATQAALSAPSALALDSAGALYITEFANCRIRKVENGIIETIAGTGDKGNYGDGIPATLAMLNRPMGMVMEGKTIFFTDYEGNRVRRIDPDGLIYTEAGVGLEGEPGDGGPATQALLNHPAGVAISAEGNLLIGDASNSVVRVVFRDWE